MPGASKVTQQPHQIVRLPRNSEFRISPQNPWIASANIKTIRGYPRISEQKIVISHPPLRRPDSSHPGDAFCMKKYKISRSGYLPKCHEVLRRPRKVTQHLHQILRLPHKMNVISDLRHICNVISNARSKQSHPPTSPNTAPATKVWVQDFTTKSLNCFREYKDDSKISEDIRTENRHLAPAASETFPVRSWRQFCIENYNISRSGYLPKCHEVLRLPRKVTRSTCTKYCACHTKWMSSVICVTYATSFPMRAASKATLQPHQILRLPRKSVFRISPQNPWIASANINPVNPIHLN